MNARLQTLCNLIRYWLEDELLRSTPAGRRGLFEQLQGAVLEKLEPEEGELPDYSRLREIFLSRL